MKRQSDDFTLTRMLASDVASVLAIEREVFPEPWSRGMFLSELFDSSVSFPYVMRVHEALVGYVIFWLVCDECHLINVAIHPAWQRRGLGKEMIAFLLRTSLAYHVQTVILEVRKSNTGARAFYEKIGFRQIGVRPCYYSRPVEDALVLRCSVKEVRLELNPQTPIGVDVYT